MNENVPTSGPDDEHDVSGFLPPRTTVVARWQHPVWATSSRQEESLIFHALRVGEVAALPAESGVRPPLVEVDLEAWDEIGADGDATRVRRSPITIQISGRQLLDVGLLPVDARRLGRLLVEAADLATEVGR